jgi:hypothetical protein
VQIDSKFVSRHHCRIAAPPASGTGRCG